MTGPVVWPLRFDCYPQPYPPAAVRLVVIPLQSHAILVDQLTKLAEEVKSEMPPGTLFPNLTVAFQQCQRKLQACI